jgi:hypothetical protein
VSIFNSKIFREISPLLVEEFKRDLLIVQRLKSHNRESGTDTGEVPGVTR